MIFRIQQLFGVVTVQGVQNPTRRRFGVPLRGPFDRWSHAISNALLGNSDQAPSLELSLATLSIEILREGTIAWVGAGAWQGSKTFRAGDQLTFAFPPLGTRSYLSVIGGFQLSNNPAVGQILQAAEGLPKPATLSNDFQLVSTIRVYRGAHAHLLDWSAFLDQPFTVSTDSNRMGIRLLAANPTPHKIDLPSEPTDLGIVQMPPSGHPIVLGPDGPTIGGYPRIACVIEADLPQVAQLPPGHEIRFVEVDRAEGEAINRQARKEEERLKLFLRSRA